MSPLTPTARTALRLATRGLLASAALAVAGLSTGCEVRSFIDPSELGGYPKRPLLVNIVDDLGLGVENAAKPFSQATDVTPEDLEVIEADYRIGPGDFVSVTVTGLQSPGAETQINRQVSATGQITLQLLPEPIEATGRTEGELEQAVIDAYDDAGIIRRESAQVSVVVIEPRGRTFSITGAVRSPSQYVIVESDFRLLDALVVSGDTTSILGIDDVFIIRDVDQDPSRGGTNQTAPSNRPPTGATGGAPGGQGGQDLLAPPGQGAPPPARPVGGEPEGPVPEGRPQFDPLVPLGAGGVPGGERYFAVQDATLYPGRAPEEAGAPPRALNNSPATAPPVGPDNAAPEGRVITIEGQPQAIGGPPADDRRVTPTENLGGDVVPPLDTSPVTIDTDGGSTRPAYGPGLPKDEGIQRGYDEEALRAAPAVSPDDFEGFNAPQEPTDQRVIRVPLQFLKQGQLKYNVVIRPGDLIVVPNPISGFYYMGGHVARTGTYALTGTKVTLKQAIIAAGMLDPVAIPQRTRIVRRIGLNQEVIARVDLNAIYEGREPDIFLQPEDQIMVGTNFVAPFIAAIRNGFRVTYGFGFLYDRNFNDNNNNR